jgi:signal transduction histidine kinase
VEGTEAVYTRFQVTGAHTLKGTGLSAPLLDDIVRNGELRDLGDSAGLLRARGLVYGTGVYDEMGRLIGIVVVHTENQSMDAMLRTTTRAMTIAAFWIALAALVGVYILSERIIRPLKHMSRAAKHFAAGQFDIRVPVAGGDEIAELATAFNQMADSLARNEDMRRTFLANVSHDLRTPMTTISGFIDCILSGAIPPEKHEHYLRIIRDEVLRLSRLVASLLDISRIQAGDRKFVMEPFDICEMGRQIIISFEQKIDKKRLEVEFDCDDDNMFVTGDHDAIYQIFYNITDNAVKFANEGGLLRISLAKVEKSKVKVAVYNEGDGIPYDDQPYIFERFYKSDRSRGKDKTGVGLGMFIAKTIIEAHKEVIALESEPGKYCEFYFTLPITPEDKRPQKSRE